MCGFYIFIFVSFMRGSIFSYSFLRGVRVALSQAE